MNLGEKLAANNLGAKLRANIDAKAEAERKAKEAAEAAERERFRRKDDDIHNALHNIMRQFEMDINAGKVIKPIKLPKHVDNLDMKWNNRSHVGTFGDLEHPHFGTIQQFFAWAENNGMVGKFIDAHDGMGMESWVEVTVEPKA